MKVTMQDVADRAGVDKATVSRVLRGDHRISEKTRIRVMEVVRAIGYKIDRNARNLSTNTSGLIGLVVSGLDRAWMGTFLAGLDRALAHSDYDLLIKSTEGSPLRARRELDALEGRRVDGIIWCDADNLPASLHVPLVCLGFTAPGAYSVTNEESGCDPTFETGVLVGRMLLNVMAGKPVPSRDIRVARTA